MARTKGPTRPTRPRGGAAAQRRAEPRRHRSSRPPRSEPNGAGKDCGRALSYRVGLIGNQLGNFRIECGSLPANGKRSCYESIVGRREPCPSCPVLSLAKAPGQKRESVAMSNGAGPFRVVAAEAQGDGQYLVHSMPLSDALVTALQRARIDRVSGEAGLSARELSVLELILLGRSSAEIAGALGITERTVRFHVANVLTKLQADSRADLLRRLL